MAHDELPTEFEPDLRHLDERLTRFARAEVGRAVPRGLAARVHEASVGGLPLRATRPTTRDRRWWAAGGGGVRLAPGRFALAASMGLAFVLAAILMRGAPVLAGGPDLAFLAEDPLEAERSRLDPLMVTTQDLTFDGIRREVSSALARAAM